MKKPARSTPRRRFYSSAGFTLIELMIVVAIIGILASVAIPAFRTVLFRSKTGEASSNLNILFKNAASYYSTERAKTQGQDAELVTGCTVDDVLPSTPRAQKQRVVPNDTFRALGFHVADYVYYSYGVATETGTGSCGGSSNDSSVYTMYANGDLDDDTILSTFELAVGSDSNNQLYHARGLYIDNETE